MSMDVSSVDFLGERIALIGKKRGLEQINFFWLIPCGGDRMHSQDATPLHNDWGIQ